MDSLALADERRRKDDERIKKLEKEKEIDDASTIVTLFTPQGQVNYPRATNLQFVDDVRIIFKNKFGRLIMSTLPYIVHYAAKE